MGLRWVGRRTGGAHPCRYGAAFAHADWGEDLVDFELRGCPIDRRQLLEVINAFLHGRKPGIPGYSVCLECKRAGITCVMVAHGTPCLGPVTQAGCGAICPPSPRRAHAEPFMQTFLNILHVFVCFFLILVVLLQQGRGGGLGAMGGATTQVFGGSGAGNFMTRLTAVCAAIFMLTSISLAYLSSSGDRALRELENSGQVP